MPNSRLYLNQGAGFSPAGWPIFAFNWQMWGFSTGSHSGSFLPIRIRARLQSPQKNSLPAGFRRGASGFRRGAAGFRRAQRVSGGAQRVSGGRSGFPEGRSFSCAVQVVLFLSSRGDFSRRGICSPTFFAASSVVSESRYRFCALQSAEKLAGWPIFAFSWQMWGFSTGSHSGSFLPIRIRARLQSCRTAVFI